MGLSKKTIFLIIVILISSISMTVINVASNVKFSRRSVYISAASSLTDVINGIIENFESEYPNITIRVSYGGSGYLATQIINGAPADILISADVREADRLIQQNFTASDSPVIFCKNILVLAGDKKQLNVSRDRDLKSILKEGKKLGIGNPDYVAAGMYTKELLTNYGLYKELSNKFIQGNSVRQVMSWLESGDVDYAFIYKTDAQLNSNITVLKEYSDLDNLNISYPMLLTNEGEANPEAILFLKYLNSDRSVSVLNRYGFIPDNI